MQVFIGVLFVLSLFGLVTKSMLGRGLIILFVAYLVLGTLAVLLWRWILIMPWWWWPIMVVGLIAANYEVKYKAKRKAAGEAQQAANSASASAVLLPPAHESGADNPA